MVTMYAAGHYAKKSDIGGWATIIQQENIEDLTLSGSKQNTDAEEATLTAIIEELTRLTTPSKVHVYAPLDSVSYAPLDWSAENMVRQAIINYEAMKGSALLLGNLRRADLWEQVQEVSGLHKVCWFGSPIGIWSSRFRFADFLARREILLANDGKCWIEI